MKSYFSFNSLLQTYGNPDVTYKRIASHSLVANRSGRFISSHVVHTGLICFGAGANTLFELARYNPSLPLGEQGFVVLPHLAGLGLGGIENGVFTDTSSLFIVAVLHLIFSAVYGGAGMLHAFRYKEKLEDYPKGSWANKFAFNWDDPDRLTFILGHHLIFLALGCIQFVEWARIHGIYDPAIGAVRKVQYNLDFGMIWNHQADFLSISSLEDVMGGHAFIALMMSAGGIFHILTKQFGEYTEFKGKGLLSAEWVLSISLAGAAYISLVAAFWCYSNSTIYPSDLYGEVLQLKLGLSPYFVDTDTSLAIGTHTGRAWLSNSHYYIGFVFLQGHLWHALRALGFNFKSIERAFENMDNAKITLND